MNHSNALNALLDHYFNPANSIECASLLAKDITTVSENIWFLDQAIDIVNHFDNLYRDKLVLLTCMIRDKFKHCY